MLYKQVLSLQVIQRKDRYYRYGLYRTNKNNYGKRTIKKGGHICHSGEYPMRIFKSILFFKNFQRKNRAFSVRVQKSKNTGIDVSQICRIKM